MLRSVEWQLVTDVSGQPIRPIFKGQKMELIGCPKISVTNCQSTLRNIPEVWSRVAAENLTVKSPLFMDLEVSLHSQGPQYSSLLWVTSCLRNTLILFSHLVLGLPSVPVFLPKFCTHVLYVCYKPRPPHPPWFELITESRGQRSNFLTGVLSNRKRNSSCQICDIFSYLYHCCLLPGPLLLLESVL
jgi:hypothetical protein